MPAGAPKSKEILFFLKKRLSPRTTYLWGLAVGRDVPVAGKGEFSLGRAAKSRQFSFAPRSSPRVPRNSCRRSRLGHGRFPLEVCTTAPVLDRVLDPLKSRGRKHTLVPKPPRAICAKKKEIGQRLDRPWLGTPLFSFKARVSFFWSVYAKHGLAGWLIARIPKEQEKRKANKKRHRAKERRPSSFFINCQRAVHFLLFGAWWREKKARTAMATATTVKKKGID